MSVVKVYGMNWCEDTQATINNLDSLGVDFDYVDLEQDRQSEAWVKQFTGGKRVTPTLDVQGSILVNLDECELETCMREKHLMG
jgi:glutaredoxin